MTRHYCARCNKLFDENDMILHIHHDREDWYCTPCNGFIFDEVQDFQKRLEEFGQMKKDLEG